MQSTRTLLQAQRRPSSLLRLLVYLLLLLACGAIFALLTDSLLLGVVVFTFLVVGSVLAGIWQENSLLLSLPLVTPLHATLSSQLDGVELILKSRLRAGEPSPALHVSSDPSPNVVILKSLGSPGLLVLHQGLFAVLSDEHWATILDAALDRLRAPGAVWRCFSVWTKRGVARLAQGPWIALLATGQSWQRSDLKGASPWGAMRFLLFWPLLRFLDWLEGGDSSDSKLDAHAPLQISGVAQVSAELQLMDPILLFGVRDSARALAK